MRRCVTLLVCQFLLAAPGLGHDIWLQRADAPAGSALVAHQWLGDPLWPEQELALDQTLTTRLALITAKGQVDLLLGLPRSGPGARPLPVVRSAGPPADAGMLVMEHDFIHTGHAPSAFAAYLAHEELSLVDDTALLEREVHRERYARAMKCLLPGGDGDSSVHTRPVGQLIEIVPTRSPDELQPGEELEVRVLLRGSALADQLVKAVHRAKSGELTTRRGRTDASGITRLRLEHAGTWLVRLTHLRACREADGAPCALADWESYWANLSFSLH